MEHRCTIVKARTYSSRLGNVGRRHGSGARVQARHKITCVSYGLVTGKLEAEG
jgi:hypothetical protein